MSGEGKRHFSATGSFPNPGKIKVWDLDSGKETLGLHGHTESVLSLALSGDGKRFFSGTSDKTIKVWDRESWK